MRPISEVANEFDLSRIQEELRTLTNDRHQISPVTMEPMTGDEYKGRGLFHPTRLMNHLGWGPGESYTVYDLLLPGYEGPVRVWAMSLRAYPGMEYALRAFFRHHPEVSRVRISAPWGESGVGVAR